MIIAGLGNPGAQYAQTRHNVGFIAADVLAGRYRTKFDSTRFRADCADFSFKGEAHTLIKPLTYMNLSGESVAGNIENQGLTPEKLLVIVDDINLPTGRVRLRQRGSDGGHNGLKSIIQFVGDSFWRLRIGVGLPAEKGESQSHHNLVNHVLGEFDSDESKALEAVMKAVPEIVTLVLIGRGPYAMGKYNGIDFAPETEPILNQSGGN